MADQINISINYSLSRHYYSIDEQGSTNFITDDAGNIKNEYYYDAFGNVLDSREEVHNRITYTGQQFDGITQQYYLRARFYNPVIGRFTQEDVYRGDGLNLYAYCGNNPVRYYDPSGYIKDWVTPKNNNDLLNIYSSNMSQADKNKLLGVDIIEVEKFDIENFIKNPPSGDDVINIMFNIDGNKALKKNKDGSLGLLNEHMIEQNIILNKLSIEHTDVLTDNLDFAKNVYSVQGSTSKTMVNSFRSKGKTKLSNMPNTGSGHTPHALDTCGGGSANMFLNSFRNSYANGTMGKSLNTHINDIVPGKEHVFELTVSIKNSSGKPVKLPLEQFLEQNGQQLNKSKCKSK
ncbi:RHS repeat-associated core domain-containing protein [Clostridium botulinum]|uniref:RHS repeat-associated core domain-containing protein n=1 Tax=Clostridium botulinum TaxID=1491 RepID=A0A6M0SSD9_CLOBO|nr:RHS repeat-associated core domain-containing protein [Clostridium botulinum]